MESIKTAQPRVDFTRCLTVRRGACSGAGWCCQWRRMSQDCGLRRRSSPPWIMGLFPELAGRPEDPETLRGRLGTHAPAARLSRCAAPSRISRSAGGAPNGRIPWRSGSSRVHVSTRPVAVTPVPGGCRSRVRLTRDVRTRVGFDAEFRPARGADGGRDGLGRKSAGLPHGRRTSGHRRA